MNGSHQRGPTEGPSGGAGRAVRFLAWTTLVLAWLWTALALQFMIGLPTPAGILAGIGVPVGLIWTRRRRTVATLLALGFVTTLVVFLSLEPRNDRDWQTATSILPAARFEPGDGRVHLENVRDFRWTSPTRFEAAWYDVTVDLDRLDSLDVVVEQFGDSGLVAHTMLSFGFGGERWVAVSVEARKEAGEAYGVLAGCFRRFELVYVIGDERDLLGLRGAVRENPLYLYPLDVDPAFIRALFVDLLQEVNRLRAEPAFYHSFRGNCATTLVEHANRNAARPIPFSVEVLFPALAGRLLERLDLLKPCERDPESFRIDARIRALADTPDLSRRLRAIPPRGSADPEAGDP